MIIQGLYDGNDPGAFANATAWSNGAITANTIFTGQSSWADYDGSIGYEIGLWAGSQATKLWSIPLFANGGSLSVAATGAYDSHYTAAAEQLAASTTSGPIYVRTGWEFNGSWEAWSAIGQANNYIAAYRQFVDSYRSVSDRFVFVWCPNIGNQGMDPATAYPGDAYVDIIGMDFYQQPGDPADPAAAWSNEVNQQYGLQWLENFAAAHGKPTAYPEWGVSSDSFGPYIQDAAAWFSSHNVIFQSYWDSDAAYAGKLSAGALPDAANAFLQAFSPINSNGTTTTTLSDGSHIVHAVAAAGASYAASDSLYSASGVLEQRVLYGASGATLETDSYNSDGTYIRHVVAAAGQPYASSDSSYTATGNLTETVFYNTAGKTLETDTYAADGSYVSHTDVTGQAYAAIDSNYSSAGVLTESVFSDIFGKILETDIYNADGSYTAHRIASTGLTYASSDSDYTTSGVITERILYDTLGNVNEIDTYSSSGAVTTQLAVSGSTSPIDISGTDSSESFAGTSGADTILGMSGNDTIIGGGGDDQLYGNMGNDLIYGGAGRDTLYGGKDEDTLIAGSGNTQLYGNLGNDVLVGGSGSDTLYGGQGNDVLRAGSGDAYLSGDRGDDTLIGGSGHDVFAFSPSSGHDVVINFVKTQDTVDLSAYNATGIHFTAVDSASGALLTASTGETILFEGSHVADLSLQPGWLI